MEVDRYAKVVNRLAQTQTDSRFSNRGPIHARIVVTAMFCNAVSTVRLYTGCLHEPFYTSNAVLESIQKFLTTSRTSRFLILSEEAPSHSVISRILDLKGASRLSIHVLDKHKVPSDMRWPDHFMVADSRAFRLEVDHENREAIVNFNEPTFSIALSNVFDTLVATCAHTAVSAQ